jgi:hypothetical protein
MRLKLYLFFIGLYFINLACLSKELSRAKADELLRASNEFGKTLNKTITLGFWSYGNCSYLESNIRQGYPDAPRDWLALKELGLVEFKDSYRPPAGFMAGIRGCEIVLSDKGRSWHMAAQGQNQYRLPLASSTFVNITGIKAEEKQTAATVEFSWQWSLTEIGAKMSNLFNDTQPKAGRALLQRYDDGWRVVEIQGVNAITSRASSPFGLFQDESFSIGEPLPVPNQHHKGDFTTSVTTPNLPFSKPSPTATAGRDVRTPAPVNDSGEGYESIAGFIGKYPISFSFREIENGQIKGSYRYQGKSQSLQLTGSVSNAGVYTLDEFDPQGKKTGRLVFRGQPTKDGMSVLSGTWTSADGQRILPFKLTPIGD